MSNQIQIYFNGMQVFISRVRAWVVANLMFDYTIAIKMLFIMNLVQPTTFTYYLNGPSGSRPERVMFVI